MPTDSPQTEKSRYETWEQSNRLSLNLMRKMMGETINASMANKDKAMEFIQKIKKCSESNLADNLIVWNLMGELITKKFGWS